jgi:multidrug efflux pump subunit AcrA (membrane-fusion protein)
LATAKGNLAATEARIEFAKSRLKNAEDLLARNFISDEEMLSLQTDLAVNLAARQVNIAAVESQELALGRTRIYAPFAAVVTSRSAQLGAYVGPGAPLLTLVQNDQREIDVEIDPRVAVGLDRISAFHFESRGTRWPVKLKRLSTVIESDSRIQHARFSFASEAAPIGSSGKVYWVAQSGLIPATYIVQRGTELGIFVAADGKAVFVPLPQAQEGRPVVTDMAPNTLLIVGGRARLQDGDPITIAAQ